MRSFEYTFTTHIDFGGPVRDHFFVLRCQPAAGPGVTLRNASVRVEPRASLSRQIDSFGNVQHVGSLRAEHDSFTYVSEGIARIDCSAAAVPCEASPLFTFASELTKPSEAMRTWLDDWYGSTYFGASDVLEWTTMQKLSHAVHELMAYEPGSTHVRTTAAEAFEDRQGVCQDFAHILIALLRDCGVPARYVSGLAEGEGQTHAWVEAHVDGVWRGLDPTRDVPVDDAYLPIARGRDWADCPIERGSFIPLTDAPQTQTVFMTMREL